jgi:hypothetical protein
MFEEVPRTRRGLARLTARHVVLGPFVIGGGVLLAAVGGSVAVATTVITASSIRASDVPPHAQHPAVVVAPSSPSHRPPAADQSDRPPGSAVSRPPAASSPASRPVLPGSPAASLAGSAGTGQPSTGPLGSGQLGPGQLGSGQPSGSPSASTSGPAGNALIFVTGYDGQRLHFEYAVVSPGAGPNGSDLYQVDSPHKYSATLASDLTVTSGGQLCPPAGSRCSIDQLTAAAGTGFFAVAAIDPADQLHSILEVDNAGPGAGSSSGFAPQATATGTPSPGPTRS